MAGALYELDRGHYEVEKKDLTLKASNEIFPQLDRYNNSPALENFFTATDEAEKEKARTELKQMLLETVAQDNSIFRAEVVDPSFQKVFEKAERPEKIRKFNTWAYCLFTRDFQGQLYSYIFPTAASRSEVSRPIGVLIVSWATPHWPPLRQLTLHYRILAIVLGCLITLLFLFFLRFSIWPLRRVSGAIEEALLQKPALLPRPRAHIERGYNDLARDALINRLQTEIRIYIQENLGIGLGDLYRHYISLAGSLFALPFASIEEIQSNASAGNTIRYHVYDSSNRRSSAVQDVKAAPEPPSGVHLIQNAIRHDESGERAELIVGFPARFYNANPEWAEETANRLAQGVRQARESLRLQQASVFRQRSEASINLAENLGHDLTNIIATAKLDLSTLQQILNIDPQQLMQAPHLRDLLMESVEHLLANSRFLQEIVNIYRAYTYLRRPNYESIWLNALLDDISALFLRSISSQIHLERQFDPDLPAMEIEPRLIKLAFFNLLTNAIDAVKKAQAAGESRPPTITVQTHFLPERKEALLLVRDSGLGIRNASGALATPEEIEAIFRLGVTTKADAVGSGLGLSWVRSIITEFHSGRIEAQNSAGGGAEFRVYLPLTPVAKSAILM